MEKSQNLKNQILLAALPFIEKEGWSMKALQTTAQALNLDPNLPEILFKNSLDTAIQELNTAIDDSILGSFSEEDLQTFRTRDKIRHAMKKRFEFFHQYPRATLCILKYLLHPLRLPLLTQIQWQTLNTFWYFAGDKATDFNYYTKRALLTIIYKSTFLYWLKNRTKPLEEIVSFMDRRFKDVAMIPQLKDTLAATLSSFNPFKKTL